MEGISGRQAVSVDYQNFFTNPDGFDSLLTQWKELAGDKPFLSTELCINNDKYQWPAYRVALTMGQLYHKNLVLADASAVCYCWTLLNVVQPSFGWTRTLTVPDRGHGFVPVAPSHRAGQGAWICAGCAESSVKGIWGVQSADSRRDGSRRGADGCQQPDGFGVCGQGK
jgi:hypothetical protein